MTQPNSAQVEAPSQQQTSPVGREGVANVAAVTATRLVKNNGTLPSGVECVAYRGTGRDIRDAARIAPIQSEKEMGFQLAMVSLRCTFDGRRVTYEDMLEMDSDDAMAAMGIMGNVKATAQPLPLPLST